MVAMEGIADSRHDRVVAEALDRTDLSTVESNRKGDARASGGTVDQHRTGSAHAVLATEMGAGEVLLHTEEIAETGAWLDRRGKRGLAVAAVVILALAAVLTVLALLPAPSVGPK